ncbi:hypothetical protein PMAYCL1PPCAC_25732, partial [Pristionchus mayeri]
MQRMKESQHNSENQLRSATRLLMAEFGVVQDGNTTRVHHNRKMREPGTGTRHESLHRVSRRIYIQLPGGDDKTTKQQLHCSTWRKKPRIRLQVDPFSI